MQKQTFYQKDTKGKTRVWTIEVDHVSDTLSNILTTTSILNEPTSVIPTTTPITEGKNIGRANETTIAQQAEFDAQTEINKKVKKGYVTDLSQVKEKDETATIKDPMKGYAYHPSPDPNNKKDKRLSLDKLGIRGELVGIERKLDGWRFRVHLTRNEVKFYTSSGDLTLEFAHISESLIKSFSEIFAYVNGKYGVTEYYLDGEIYCHGLQLIKDNKNNITGMYYEPNTSGFNAAASACASVKNITPAKQALRDAMHFYLFDVCMDAPHTTRKKVLEYFYSDVVKPVETIYINAQEDKIEELMNQFLNEGYEGLMIRQLNIPYEYKRTKQLTKYKPMIDDEFQIVGFKKSISGDTLGSLELIMEDGTKFFANLKNEIGDDKTKQEIWDNQANYLSKWVTVDFMEYTPDGIPRHPRAKAFRKGKSQD